MPIGLIVALIIAAGAGVSLSASNDLPGERLYPVKIQVNEELSDAVSLSARTQAHTDAEIAARRVGEAEELAVKGELDAQVAANLEQRFEERAQAFEELILRLNERGNAEAAAEATSDFEASLEAHERVLANLQAQEEHLTSMLARVRARIDRVEAAREDAEARITSQLGVSVEAAARGRLRALENKIAEVQNSLDRVESRLSAQASADAEAQLQIAKNLKTEGEMKLDLENYGEAFLLFQQAHRAAQQAEFMARSSGALNVHVGLFDDDDIRDDEIERGDEEDGDENDGEDNDSEDDSAEIEAEGEVRLDVGL